MENVSESANESGRLASRLTKISTEQLGQAQSLFSQALEFEVDDQYRIVLVFAQDPLQSCHLLVDLQAGEDTLELGIGTDLLATPLGDQHWNDFDWRSRLLAWTSAHGQLLDAMAGLFGALVPTRLKKSNTALPTAGRVWFGLRILREGKLVIDGALALPCSYVSSLLLRRETIVPRDLSGISLPLAIRAVGPAIAPEALSALMVGDVIVLGHSARAFAAIRICLGGSNAPLSMASWDTKGLIVRSSQSHIKIGESRMSEIESSSPSESDTVAKLPLELTFELGQVSVSVAQLQRLQPGYVFDLPQPIEGAEVSIAVSGQSIGRGELVAAGDTLGVRVLSWDDDGLQ